MGAPGSKAERGDATRNRLIAVARELFAERGYAGAPTEEIVQRAGVTRGALYHHFSDKKDLFRAVHEEIEDEVIRVIASRMDGITDAREALRTGTLAFLDFCTDPSIARIALVDAPSVLGWQEWREIDLRYSLGLVIAALEAGMEAGDFRRQASAPLAHLLVGAMSEAGMMIANSDRPAATRREVEPALLDLIDGLG
jgi:AcrR family transcriptional regulator